MRAVLRLLPVLGACMACLPTASMAQVVLVPAQPVYVVPAAPVHPYWFPPPVVVGSFVVTGGRGHFHHHPHGFGHHHGFVFVHRHGFVHHAHGFMHHR